MGENEGEGAKCVSRGGASEVVEWAEALNGDVYRASRRQKAN